MAPDFIDGIYNYCDRWCERCPLTARCRLFALNQQLQGADDKNAAFWQFFDELAASQPQEGVINDWFSGEESEDEFQVVDEDAWRGREERGLDSIEDRHPLVKLAMDYGHKVHQWQEQFADSGQLDAKDTQERADSSGKRGTVGKEDALDIIGWYGSQIGVKLARSLSSGDDEDDEDDEDEEYLDADDEGGLDWEDEDNEEMAGIREGVEDERNGSAKVSLIGIERSLGAWTILRDHFPEHESTIRDFQRTLARLRRYIDEQIPGARTFQRPGFEFEV